MGAALIIVPVFIVIAAVIWVFFAAGKTSQARKADESLPDHPAERHDEEVRRLQQDHRESESPYTEV